MYLSMPVESCSLDGKSGFRYGKEGKCYTYTSGDESSKQEARKKANAQGIAMRATGYIAKQNVVSSGTMGSGIKNPQQGYGKKKKKKNKVIEDIKKNLDTWFRERWVDISRPKKGGGYEQCGRRDASTGKYPKCVPASRAARMSESQRRSAVQRKRRAESTQQRKDKNQLMFQPKKWKKEMFQLIHLYMLELKQQQKLNLMSIRQLMQMLGWLENIKSAGVDIEL